MIIIIVVVVQENAPTQKEVTRGKIKNIFWENYLHYIEANFI